MKVTNINYSQKNKKARLSAQIVLKNGKKHYVYFEVVKEFKDFIAKDASPFLAVVLMLAMKIGEDLYIEGSISETLYHQTERIMNLLISWDVGFKKVKIYPDRLVKDEREGSYIGSFFSGGVDSFYTLLKNKKESKDRITQLILVHGFDIELENISLFQEILKNIEKIANAGKLSVVVVETNLRKLTDKLLEWDFGHGGALAAVSLLLRDGFKRVYIPSSYTYDTLYPWGSHPDLDPLWATENLKIIHDGCNVSRVQKTLQYIAHSETALKYLRVCWKNEKGKYNCGVCPKCIRTMVDLRIAGVADKSIAFEKKLDLKLFNKIDARSHGSRIYYKQSLEELKKTNKDPELQAGLHYLLYEKKYGGIVQETRDFVGDIDRKYNSGRLYKFLSHNGII